MLNAKLMRGMACRLQRTLYRMGQLTPMVMLLCQTAIPLLSLLEESSLGFSRDHGVARSRHDKGGLYHCSMHLSLDIIRVQQGVDRNNYRILEY